MYKIAIDKIIVQERARAEFDNGIIAAMAEDFANPLIGVLYPPLLSADNVLIDGETRLKAMRLCQKMSTPIYINGQQMIKTEVPVLRLSTTDSLTKLQVELKGNVTRKAFTWREEALQRQKILNLQQELHPEKPVEAALEILGEADTTYNRKKLKEAVRLADAVVNNEGAFKACVNKQQATRVKRRLDQQEEDEVLATEMGREVVLRKHRVLHGDCVKEMQHILSNTFDLCITDPPYGINAHKFGNSGGRMSGYSHGYDDSPEYWESLMPKALKELSRVMKPYSHIYIACDISKFEELKGLVLALTDKTWEVQRTPLIELKTFGRLPVADFYYRRTYECWLYARTGKKSTKITCNDTILKTVQGFGDKDSHHAAVKGVDVYGTFLKVSGQVAGEFIDPFTGSGSVIPSVIAAGMTYTGIEQEQSAYGSALKKLQETVGV